MGDRANVAIQEGGKRVWLYTHWNGTELPATVQRALARNQRWTDASYLARIIFCEMIKEGGDLNSETGFGISTETCDTTRVLVVDVTHQQVQFGTTDLIPNVGDTDGIPFEQFIKQPTARWPSGDDED